MLGSVLALALVVVLCAAGAGSLPALGPTFGPGGGIWRLSAEATGNASGRFTVAGLRQPATVTFENNGIAHITTADDSDLWRVTGYVQARFRLMQMDLARRQGEGRLAAVLGPAALPSDEMELNLGLVRAAERDWAQMPSGDARTSLTAYSAGVNAATDQLRAAGELPTAFTLLGYAPQPWTPVDTLVIQREETQTLSFSTAALIYSYAAGAMDPATFVHFFPEVPSTSEQPYDPGPYLRSPLTALPLGADPASASTAGTPPPGPPSTAPGTAAPGPPSAADAGIGRLLDALSSLPAGEVHDFGASNAWVVSGAHTASGKPLLASDPHLDFGLPAIWYELEGTSPGYHFQGVTIPGTPVPLIGRTDAFSWGITDAQRPTTLFYLEETDPAKPGRYYWDGAWRAMQTLDYTIAVKGAPSVDHAVELTVHGPVLQLQGRTTSVWWAGALPSQNIADVLTMLRARDFASFRSALQDWATPALNVVYADRAGHIGAFGIGVAPQVPGHDITLPLTGDGSADVAGSIPYDALPHAYDPPSGYLVSANQREVTAAYPYQYSSSYNFPDPGYRANEIAEHLAGSTRLTATDFRRLQTDEHDDMAEKLMPALLGAMAGQPLSPLEQQVLSILSTWDHDMSPDSSAPTISQTAATHLVSLVFEPWWTHFAVPSDPEARLAPQPFAASATTETLLSTTLGWILHEPADPYLSPPRGPTRDATAVLRQDFHETVDHLARQYGPDPGRWDYGARHSVLFPSLLQSPPLSRGPYPRGGDGRTINAADGAPGDAPLGQQITTGGASWRFVMDWGSGQGAGVYPGGQSESPLSPWYDDGIPMWLSGRLWPMYYGTTAAGTTDSTTWGLTP
jgi:penicillin amidase